jgi:hypothetical protein
MKQLALIIPIMIAATVLSACNTTPEELGSNNMATPKTTTAAKAAPKVTTQGVTTRFQCPPFCIDPFGWQQSSPTTVDALLQIDAAKDKDGFPVIAKITWTPFWTSPVEVRHWTGNTWESLPNLLLEHQAQGVALAVTKAKLGNGTIDETIFGQPYVATIGENRITVHTWIGGEWVQTGGFLNVPGRTYPMGQPAIAVRPNGNPVVAWRTTSNLIAVSEWDETAWKTSYVNDNQTTLAKSDPSLALKPTQMKIRSQQLFVSVKTILGTRMLNRFYRTKVLRGLWQVLRNLKSRWISTTTPSLRFGDCN